MANFEGLSNFDPGEHELTSPDSSGQRYAFDPHGPLADFEFDAYHQMALPGDGGARYRTGPPATPLAEFKGFAEFDHRTVTAFNDTYFDELTGGAQYSMETPGTTWLLNPVQDEYLASERPEGTDPRLHGSNN